MVFIKPHDDDIVTATMPPCCKCAHQATNTWSYFISVLMFWIQVVLFQCLNREKIIRKLRRPAPKVFSGAWSLTVVA